MGTSKAPWVVVTAAAAAGIGFTAIQTVERIAILKDPASSLLCDVNSLVSCSTVLGAWQSSVILGVPNAFIGAVMFSLFLATGLAGLLGSTLSRAFLLTVLGLVVFFAAFATWFMVQTAFVIGALCLWCLGIVTAVAAIGGAVTRVAARSAPAQGRVALLDRSGVDLLAWAGWWVLVVGLVAVGLLS